MFHFFRKNLPRIFLSKEDTKKLIHRVSQFEMRTGCELVFHFRRQLGKKPVEFNRRLFYKFKLDRTTGHRGILITLALRDRKFAVWADQGVAIHTGDKLWKKLCEKLSHDLKTESHLQALLNSVDLAQSMLQDLAPLDSTGHKKEFANELSDAPIIEGDNE